LGFNFHVLDFVLRVTDELCLDCWNWKCGLMSFLARKLTWAWLTCCVEQKNLTPTYLYRKRP